MIKENNKALSIYIHIPFCKDRCIYCDFYSTKYNETSNLLRSYLEAIIKEFERLRDFTKKRIETIYIGGGTPSIVPTNLLSNFLESLLKKIKLTHNYEFTIEMNPESAKRELLRLLNGYGINRISLGVQSLEDEILKKLNRVHNTSDTYTALNNIFNSGYCNVSVDFLIGTTCKTDRWVEKIYKLISNFPIKHISAYILTIDEKTRSRTLKEFLNIEENIIIEQYQKLHRMLKREGFIHYEISNYAKKGFESAHNLNYWKCGYYLGLGASASGYIVDTNRIRYKNISDVKKYIKQENEKNIDYEEYEIIDNKKMINEIIMLGLRIRDGFKLNKIKSLMKNEEYELFLKKLKDFQREGLIKIQSNRITPTLKGFLLNNMIVRELMF